MRWHEIASGLRMHVSGEEQAILDRAMREDLPEDKLDERDQEVARQMVSRGLLHRLRQKNGALSYRPSMASDFGRDPT